MHIAFGSFIHLIMNQITKFAKDPFQGIAGRSNVEVSYSVYSKKGLSKAKPPFDILRLDIRYSAVRCSVQFHKRF